MLDISRHRILHCPDSSSYRRLRGPIHECRAVDDRVLHPDIRQHLSVVLQASSLQLVSVEPKPVDAISTFTVTPRRSPLPCLLGQCV
jgi:hypothetical protein